MSVPPQQRGLPTHLARCIMVAYIESWRVSTHCYLHVCWLLETLKECQSTMLTPVPDVP